MSVPKSNDIVESKSKSPDAGSFSTTASGLALTYSDTEPLIGVSILLDSTVPLHCILFSYVITFALVDPETVYPPDTEGFTGGSGTGGGGGGQFTGSGGGG